ncbi:MAG: hypothetical protein ABIY55_27540, partial [Kofleriaceae bacterium]
MPRAATKPPTAFARLLDTLPPERDRITQVRARVTLGADQILLADADLDARVWLRTVVAGRLGLDEVDTAQGALDQLASGGVRILIVGRHLVDAPAETLLAHAAARGALPVTFLLADPSGEVAQVDDNEIPVFYRLVRGMDPKRLLELLA